MGRLALIVIALAGCRQAFGIDDVVPAPDAGTGPSCSRMSMLADDFEDNDLDVMWPVRSAGFTEANGKATITTSDTAVLTSSRYYDLREDSFAIAISDTNTYGANDSWELRFDSQHKNYGAVIVRTATTLTFYRVDNGTVFSVSSTTYDSLVHKYFRVSESHGITTFETSQDGITYAVQALYPIPNITFVRVTLSVMRASGTPITLTIDDVNRGTPIGKACPVSQLADDFTGAALDDKWGRSGAINGAVTQHDAVVELAFMPNGIPSSIYLVPSAIYNVEEGSVALEISTMIDTSGTETLYFAVAGTKTSEALFQVANNTLVAETYATMATVVASEPLDLAADRWLRIRNAAQITYWEASPNGQNWRRVAQTAEVSSLDRAEISLQITGMTNTADALVLDSVGSPP